jgi:hypothetical protein
MSEDEKAAEAKPEPIKTIENPPAAASKAETERAHS